MTETHPEELFPPKPGGMVDTVRRQRQAEADQLAAYAVTEPGETGPGGGLYEAIRVRPQAPDTGIPKTITLSEAYPVAQLLPADPQRRVAIVLAIDNDVYLTKAQGPAADAAGSATSGGPLFYLPKGIVIPISDQDKYWVAATTTSSTSRVSVLVSRDS
ncbi:MAG TPA: hypothetical protein VFX70_08135 [Mycobacteriales bacterium]|nr:hypothetical protein [Mycobacteriales bacterium]